MVNLDGSVGEGGGQMLRSALLWSTLTQTPFRMVKIRENRKDPGLKAQHLHVIRALQAMGPVKVSGAQIGSRTVTFEPAPLAATEADVDVGTAGSLTLLLQTLLPVALATPGAHRFRLTGGTDVAWSPPVDYLRNVVLGPAMLRSWRMTLDVVKRGFYPAGGGEIRLEVQGWKEARPIDALERGRLVQIRILSTASTGLQDRRVAERQGESAADVLRRFGARVHVESAYGETRSPGSVVTCVADFAGGQKAGGSALGEKGRPAEEVGRQAAEQLAREIEAGAPVDEHAADQLIPWVALNGGAYRASRISEHTRSNLWVTEQFLGKVVELEDHVIRCRTPFAVPCR
jgi:RNA 3'-terminal phosphate cyclase (GTP)